jgi:hypothetical protein
VPAGGPVQQHADEADQREPDQGRREEEHALTEQHERGDHEHDGADDRGGLAAVLRLPAAGGIGGHEQPGGEIAEDARAAGQRQHHEADAEDDRVDVEVAAEPAGHAAEHLVGGGAGQPARLRPGAHRLRGGGRRVRLRLVVGLLGRCGCVGHRKIQSAGRGDADKAARSTRRRQLGISPRGSSIKTLKSRS